MEKQIQVYHHLGLGDHIICNGLVRELSTHYQKVYLFVKKVNLYNVSFMYRDEPKIELVTVKDDSEVQLKSRKDIDLITIGLDKLDVSNNNFDESFYRQVGYDFSLRWDKFYVKRDLAGEQELIGKINPTNLPYILIHDDPSRGLRVDLNRVRIDMKIIKPSDVFSMGKLKPEYHKYNLFHWIGVLEKAEEIHCMDSSFKCLVESLPYLGNAKLLYHSYVRGEGPRKVSSMRKEWTIIRHPSLSFRVATLIDSNIRKAKNKVYRYKWVQRWA